MSSQSGTKSTGQKDIISNQDMIQFFRQHPLCSSLSDSYLETLVSRCCVREYRKGGVIFRKGEPALWIHFIYSGSVSEIINYGGSSDVLSTLRRPGDYIGEMGAMIGEPYPNTAIARVNLATIAMPREAFLELTHENTTIANYITTQFIYRLMNPPGGTSTPCTSTPPPDWDTSCSPSPALKPAAGLSASPKTTWPPPPAWPAKPWPSSWVSGAGRGGSKQNGAAFPSAMQTPFWT